MVRLRDPEHGCPWDLEQTFASIAPYTVEEAYEVADAIERGDMADLRDELGDLLLQVAFHSRMAEERGAQLLGQHSRRRIFIDRSNRHRQQSRIRIGEPSLRHQSELNEDSVEALVRFGGDAPGTIKRPLVAMA